MAMIANAVETMEAIAHPGCCGRRRLAAAA
jgi:hypothetical protein